MNSRLKPIPISRFAAVRWLGIFGVLIFAGAAKAASPDAPRIADIDDIFSAIDSSAPGCNVGVIVDGRWAHKQGYGMANLEMGVPLDGSQVHRIGSVSKQFTAMAVLLLAEEGKIDLRADIHDYLPQLRDYGAQVTVNAMLGHTAGMGDYEMVADSPEGPEAAGAIDLRNAAGGPFRLGNEDYLTIDEFYDVVKRVPLVQAPDQEQRYSNLAYFLLSMLVEEVSGESLREYAQRRIFQRLGMNSSFFSDDPVEVVRNRASGYDRDDTGRFINSMTNLFWVGDGGLHSNLDDLLLWDQQFYNPSVGDKPKQLMRLMNTPNSQLESDGALYANGQFVSDESGFPAYFHSGGWLGTQTYYARFPEQKTSLITLCNDASLDMDSLVDATLEYLLVERANP